MTSQICQFMSGLVNGLQLEGVQQNDETFPAPLKSHDVSGIRDWYPTQTGQQLHCPYIQRSGSPAGFLVICCCCCFRSWKYSYRR